MHWDLYVLIKNKRNHFEKNYNLFLNFFIKKCQASNLSIEAFKMLLQYRKFVILFDGFDEVAKRVNYDVKFSVFNQICKYCTGETKVIITCRPNYFQEQKEYKDLIENAHLEFEPDRGFKMYGLEKLILQNCYLAK